MSDDRCIGLELGQDEYLARIRTEQLDPSELAARYGLNGQRAPDALSAEHLHERLETLVSPVLSMRRSVRAPADALAWLPGHRVEAMLGHLEQVARSSLELTYSLSINYPDVIGTILITMSL